MRRRRRQPFDAPTSRRRRFAPQAAPPPHPPLPPTRLAKCRTRQEPPPQTTSYLSSASLSALIFSCTAQCSHHPGEQLHVRAIMLGLEANPSVLPRLASSYIALGDLPAARAAAEQAAGKARAFPWNLLIWDYAGRGLWEDVILAYEKMLALGVDADRFTYLSLLRACGVLREVTIGRKID